MSAVAEFYNANVYPDPRVYFNGRDNHMVASLSPRLIKTVPDGSQILVVGCGTAEAVCVGMLYPNSVVTALDVSKASLAVSRSLARKKNVKNVHHICNDIVTYNPHHTFNYISASGVLHHIPDLDGALNNIYKLMAKGGLFSGFVYERDERIRLGFEPKLVKMFRSKNFTVADVRAYFQNNDNKFFNNHVKFDTEIADTWLHPYFKEFTSYEMSKALEKSLFQGCSVTFWKTVPETGKLLFEVVK